MARVRGYPKAGPVGGRLIREVVRALREQGLSLPITSHILIAVSGGSDSMALAHLLVRYGRRVANKSLITLLHVNHGWRGPASDADARFVRVTAKKWGVPAKIVRLKSAIPKQGDSWEDHARTLRKEVFGRLTPGTRMGRPAIVLTAHQGDDLAETLLWRLFTGSTESHGGGIAGRHGAEYRPLLRIRKAELKEYLNEEGQTWREDSTNAERRFLRSRMRQEILPAIEMLFPRAVTRLIELAFKAQQGERESGDARATDAFAVLFQASGLRVRRAHWMSLQAALKEPHWKGELHLPGGWKLVRRGSGGWLLEENKSGH